MNIDDAIVETSDQEELEELAAATSQYWQVNTRDIARRRGTVHRAAPQTEVDELARLRSSARLLAERRQTKKYGSPPRKRRKCAIYSAGSSYESL
ncbi:hypothetical protein C8Q74DRAFT_1273380 [Fomes fomentarius]|nr:hypothetical protein C8Q74DRAFT_1273380 [Fomes fomentarius]